MSSRQVIELTLCPQPWSVNISKALPVFYPEFQLGATVDDPLWPYDTPQARAQFDCVSALAAGADDGHTVKTCSEHTYQYSVGTSNWVLDLKLTSCFRSVILPEQRWLRCQI